ncbi:uncharacterized protein G2W53_026343 [Senna tora]|uniref:Uncharacterized protein n=1 Tax=Senna tora TaxID=362788 RepID=A0A834TEV5_9FABA|nr:uncharacterized protein G2W53_026343 [Senna tora]
MEKNQEAAERGNEAKRNRWRAVVEEAAREEEDVVGFLGNLRCARSLRKKMP